MTVPPASQLTRRMVPASTLRRNPATMSGMPTNTMPNTIAMRTQPDRMPDMFRLREVKVGPAVSVQRHRASIVVGVDRGDAQAVAGMDCRSRGALGGEQGGEHLDHLSVQLDRHEALSLRIE